MKKKITNGRSLAESKRKIIEIHHPESKSEACNVVPNFQSWKDLNNESICSRHHIGHTASKASSSLKITLCYILQYQTASNWTGPGPKWYYAGYRITR